jgi:putative tricarboxylic transport membrane protein
MSGQRQRVIDWEHLCFLSALVAFVAWYLWDSAAASPTFSNLILIAPAGAFAVILAFYIALTEVLPLRPGTGAAAVAKPAPPAEPSRFRAGSLRTIALLMGLFGLFVAAIPYAGFDVAAFAFTAATLWLLGERRILFGLLLALGLALGVSIAAQALLTVPMPMTVVRYGWSAF